MSIKWLNKIERPLVRLSKSVVARHYCPKIPQVPGTLGTRANSSPVYSLFSTLIFAIFPSLLWNCSNTYSVPKRIIIWSNFSTFTSLRRTNHFMYKLIGYVILGGEFVFQTFFLIYKSLVGILQTTSEFKK